jgi:cellulose synthase/poly-beta-1,6-N-acetylglucosamine synthase-like glycosyltransferase
MLIATVVLGLSLVLLVPAAFLLAECVAALFPERGSTEPPPRSDESVAVVVPAYNEAEGIAACIASLRPQLTSVDRLIVVADNCDDDTADAARRSGAQVWERREPDRRGKGFALQFGLERLAVQPPDVVMFVDADHIVGPGTVSRLAVVVVDSGMPVQSCYLVEPPDGAILRDRLSAFAFAIKNWVRPRGLRNLGLPCLLTGSGMAFPWPLIHSTAIAGERTAEDMRLSVELALAGRPPRFCERARVHGRLSSQRRGGWRQRARWEHGHLETLVTGVPALLRAAVNRSLPRLIGLALELFVPPLSLLMLLWSATMVVAFAADLLETAGAFALISSPGLTVTAAVSLAWWRFGRGLVPFRGLIAAPVYAMRKLPLYLAAIGKRESTWTASERDAPRK